MAPLPPHRVPLAIEIYSTIFQHVATGDLTTLCRVSKTFQKEAERILYCFVDIVHVTDGERLMSWCHAIAECPPRAFLVRSLRLPGSFRPDSAHFSSQLVQQAIGQALRTFVNLEELFVRSHSNNKSDTSPTLLLSTFDGCQFSLSALSGDLPGFTSENVWKLLSVHPKIRYWVASDTFMTSISSIPLEVLPNVSDVVFVCPKMTKYLVGRPLKRLVWVFQSFLHTRSEGTEAIVPLKFFKHSLTDLHYTYLGKQDSDWTYADIIRCIATHAPNLKCLVISSWHLVKSTVDSAAITTKLMEAVSGFRQLETLKLDIDAINIPCADSDPISKDTSPDTAMWSGYSPTECRKVATLFMTSCPALRHMSFELTEVKSGGGRNTCCFIRSMDHQAKLEGFNTIDTTSWWMR